jgi:signal transduction histidine kinase
VTIDSGSPGDQKGVHSVQFYEDGGFPSQGIVRFLTDALDAKHGLVLVATQINLTALRAGLKSQGYSLQQLEQAGHVTVVDANVQLQRLIVDERIDAGRFEEEVEPVFARLLDSHAVVSCYAEMVDLLLRDGKVELMLSLEQTWNEYIRDQAINLLCGYHIDWLPKSGADLLMDIAGHHTQVLPNELSPRSVTQQMLWRDYENLRSKALAAKEGDLAKQASVLSDQISKLEKLIHRLIQLRDQQDRWMSKYLNTEVVENLNAILLNLSGLSSLLMDEHRPDSPVAQRIHDLNHLVKHMVVSLGQTLNNLHTPVLDDFGLAASLRSFAYGMQRYTNADIQFEFEPNEDFRLSPNMELNIMQVIREAITNAIKHGHASHIEVSITKGVGTLDAYVQDNGGGLGDPRDGLGLQMMLERVVLMGGKLDIQSLDDGVRVQFHIDNV